MGKTEDLWLAITGALTHTRRLRWLCAVAVGGGLA